MNLECSRRCNWTKCGVHHPWKENFNTPSVDTGRMLAIGQVKNDTTEFLAYIVLVAV